MIFYLGTHEPTWLTHPPVVPLMISRNRLARLGRLPTAAAPWVLDSGGFTELQRHGHWRTTASQYADEVQHYEATIGRMVWAAPQDWMCEPAIINGLSLPRSPSFVGTGLSVSEHQDRTVSNYLELRSLGANVIPVLQGFTLDDYERCAELYTSAGVDLKAAPTVGLGSVCRRQATAEIGAIVGAMHSHGYRLHGFGCKEGAVRMYGSLLHSADSMAWSLGGRKRGPCTHLRSRCANHEHYARSWRDALLTTPPASTVQLAMF